MSLEDAKANLQKSNPSVATGQAPAVARKRIPLSTPQRKLEVPEIPGFYLRWFRGTPARIAQAENAGFVFVTQDEVKLNSLSLGGDATKDGNTDMGSRVSVVEGSEVDGGGNAVRLYLMKQPIEFKKEDDAAVQQRNDETVATLTAQFKQGTVGGIDKGETPEDAALRYVGSRARVPELFRKGKRR